MRANYTVPSLPYDRVKVAVLKSEFDDYCRSAMDVAQGKVNDRCREIISDEMDKYGTAMDATVMWVLHEQFGFGKDRCRRVWDAVIAERKEIKKMILDGADESTVRHNEAAETGAKDWDFYLIHKLENVGIPIREWENEEVDVE